MMAASFRRNAAFPAMRVEGDNRIRRVAGITSGCRDSHVLSSDIDFRGRAPFKDELEAVFVGPVLGRRYGAD
jgi:hypothetical protein